MTGAVRAEASGASDRIAPRDNTPVCRDKCVLPVPLVIGVTGHRDLRPEDSASLEQAVRGVFRDLRRRCPSTPLVLLSPLAEGADRLVARVALDEGASIRVPLPLPLEVYEQDFPDATSRQEFRALLGQASAIFTIGLKSGTSADSVRTPGPQRDGQYEALGAFIARNSLILIALWDGRDSDAVGGTAQVLSFQRSGLPTAYADIDDVSPLDMADTGPVYQVVTPRIGKPDPPAPAFTVIRLLPTCGWSTDASDEDISDTFDRILGCID